MAEGNKASDGNKAGEGNKGAPTDAISIIKYVYSTGLLIFSFTLVIGLIFTQNTKLSKDVSSVLALIVMFGALIWLNMIEGGQGPMVGLPPVDRELYAESHPKTYKICSICHKGDNLDRYLVGRQFMVLCVVFVTNLCGAPIGVPEVFGLPEVVLNIFLGSGVAMILMTTMFGQLNSQVNASVCMLDYVNNYFMLFTLYVALAIELSGLLHTCYLVQMFFSWLAGKPMESQEAPRDFTQNLFYWGRILISLAILAFAFAVTLGALFQGKTTMWPGVPNGVGVILFFVFMSIVGLLEGMQIAFFAVTKLAKSERGDHPIARKTCHLLFKDANLARFMVGRQICVTLNFFIIARVTTMNVEVGTGENLFGVSDGVQSFFNTGLLGALITTIVGSITWQLVAGLFPVAFLSNPLVYVFLRICLLLEATGICGGAWVLAMIHKKIAGFQYDEVYIGTPEERAARKHADHDIPKLKLGTNILVQAPGATTPLPDDWIDDKLGPLVSFTERRQKILSNIRDCRQILKESSTGEERLLFQQSLDLELKAMKDLNEEEEEIRRLHTSLRLQKSEVSDFESGKSFEDQQEA